MSLLDSAVSSPLPQTPPQSPTPTASPAITTLPPLGSPPNERFLDYSPSVAGRAVVIELQSRPGDSRKTRQRLWETYQREGNIQELGLAAQTLERAGVNWRQAKRPTEVLEAFRALPQESTN